MTSPCSPSRSRRFPHAARPRRRSGSPGGGGHAFAGKSTAVAAIAERGACRSKPDILVKEAMAEAAAWNAGRRLASPRRSRRMTPALSTRMARGDPAEGGAAGGGGDDDDAAASGVDPAEGGGEAAPEPAEESSPAPRSRKVELGSVALAADGAGDPIPRRRRALVAVAVGALAPPPPPPLTVVPRVTTTRPPSRLPRRRTRRLWPSGASWTPRTASAGSSSTAFPTVSRRRPRWRGPHRSRPRARGVRARARVRRRAHAGARGGGQGDADVYERLARSSSSFDGARRAGRDETRQGAGSTP